jgi:cystathionine gamma-synthase
MRLQHFHQLRQISTRYLATITPEEAGQKAYELAQQLLKNEKGQLQLSSILAHAGLESLNETYNSECRNMAMSPPLHMSTTYTRPPNGRYHESDSVYSRVDNPTRLLLEATMFQLETHGRDPETDICSSFAFSSGMMAASSIILSHQSPVHVILPKDLYHGVTTVLNSVFDRFNVTTEHIDLANDIEALQKSVAGKSNVIVWIESPSNPLCHVIDIKAVCEAVQNANVTVVVDSTLAPPVITQPLHLGADLVMHSATKYLGGHSDALCGIVTASPWTDKGKQLAGKLQQTQTCVGGVASSFDSWLVLRGIRTLNTRVEQQCSTAIILAKFLEEQEGVYKVYYPGLPNPDNLKAYEVAKRQMTKGQKKLFGGLLSVEMDSESKAYALAGALQLIQRATSLGGTETLIEHRASIEPATNQTSPKGLLRISVGLEDPEDLINDLIFALNIANEIHKTPEQ